ncbi:MAG: ATP-binding protein [Desulfobulbaceae bacterium]|nr:ATP-binding protein [Desulfobulbaceae bacterium]
MARRPKITDVFTPRRAEVNHAIYVQRSHHEKALKRSVEGSLHTIVSGESGSGKSWLFKKVAAEENWAVFTGNFANAARANSISSEIFNALVPTGSREWVEITESIDAKLKVLLAEGGGKADRKYAIKTSEEIEAAFTAGRKQAGERTAVLVLDNLEAIFREPNLMSELGNIILLLDDERYARHTIKIVLIGVPANIIDYYQKIENLEPVGNRIEQIPHIQSFTETQVLELIRKGFNDLLRAEIPDGVLNSWNSHIYLATLGVAQRVHEYCEKLAYFLDDNDWDITVDALKQADHSFMCSSIYQAYAVIDKCMNERETKAGRRNQVLYSLGKLTSTAFDAGDVEKRVRKEFPNSTRGVTLGVCRT